MRFHVGRIPQNPDFRPNEQGWIKCREPSIPVFMLFSIPIAALLVVTLVTVIAGIGEPRPMFVMRPDDPASKLILFLGLLAGLFALTIVLHEGIHVLAHPGMGLSDDTIVGVSPRHVVAFASYDNEIGRGRFLWMVALPFLLLSVAPVFLFAVMGSVNPWIAWLAVINGLGSCFDVTVILIVITQIPRGAVMRNLGWETYWKVQNENYSETADTNGQSG